MILRRIRNKKLRDFAFFLACLVSRMRCLPIHDEFSPRKAPGNGPEPSVDQDLTRRRVQNLQPRFRRVQFLQSLKMADALRCRQPCKTAPPQSAANA